MATLGMPDLPLAPITDDPRAGGIRKHRCRLIAQALSRSDPYRQARRRSPASSCSIEAPDSADNGGGQEFAAVAARMPNDLKITLACGA